MSFNTEINGLVYNDYNLVQIIPYLLVLIGGIAGFNVFLVLITGIVSGMVIMTFTGQITAIGLITNMGSGVSGMFETCMVAVLVSAMCALIREYGGFDALLYGIKKYLKVKKPDSSEWDFLWELWTLQLPIIRLRLSWLIL